MDNLKKFLRKLPKVEQKKILSVLYNIRLKQFDSLDIKPLKGSGDLFRARIGNYRIIYRLSNGRIDIVDAGHRSEKTYRDL